MAVQVYADGSLVYDARLEEYALLGLKTTTGLNKGGTLELILRADHPAYNSFVSYKTIVTLYENGVLRFRGRALYPSGNWHNIRTVTCEGERCFLRDANIRPYLYQDNPAAIFAEALALYNAAVDPFKRFSLGEITVTDDNDYIRLESESAETFAAFFDKLVERCGGYITFTDDGAGGRAINWLAEIGRQSTQAIEFGSNLLEFASSGESPDLATAVLPYGAQLEDGTRVTISSVTEDGKDYIVDKEAAALRGIIEATVTWDDVTEPANLLTKAKAWLAEHKLAINSLSLTAADLSRMDRSIDSFVEGDLIPVKSAPHGVNGLFQLTDRTTDWLDPSGGSITLGKALLSLTGADVTLERTTAKGKIETNVQINAVKKEALEAVDEMAKEVLEAAEEQTTSKIEQLQNSITMEVTGSLGSQAIIKLTVGETEQDYTLDLAHLREAFANDNSAVTIAAGRVTFTGGTIVIDSNNFQVSADGTIKATNAEISGVVTTLQGRYKATLDSGGVDLYYREDDEYILCGVINSRYWSNASGKGISLRIEEGGNYIMFSHPNPDTGSGYDVDYYLNYGWSTNYKEMHIFQTSARFLDAVVFSGAGATFSALYMYEHAFIRSREADGAVGEEMLGYANNTLYVGNNSDTTILRGSTVYLKNTSTTVTSDRKAKNSIEALPDAYEALFDRLVPVRFKYNEGTSDRYHVGFIAQDVAAALNGADLTTQDFAGYVDINHTGELGLAYDEFIGLLANKIKRLEQRLGLQAGL